MSCKLPAPSGKTSNSSSLISTPIDTTSEKKEQSLLKYLSTLSTSTLSHEKSTVPFPFSDLTLPLPVPFPLKKVNSDGTHPLQEQKPYHPRTQFLSQSANIPKQAITTNKNASSSKIPNSKSNLRTSNTSSKSEKIYFSFRLKLISQKAPLKKLPLQQPLKPPYPYRPTLWQDYNFFLTLP